MQNRHFTSGSRQAPDPFDQYLEANNYYRKHTARDGSCFFRVISEQIYDTQMHHLFVRKNCVKYMRTHRKMFEGQVDRDFDEYLDDMLQPKSYGTLLELQAAGSLYERNVILFEPFNLGNYYKEYKSEYNKEFRVFYTPERHFDSVFTAEYIEEAAMCQSICYEILYKDVFKLPDVSFAVEQMLHGSSFDDMEYRTDVNEDGYATRLYLSSEKVFVLDLPRNTNCILENHRLCHFHSPNFPRLLNALQREIKGAQTAESFLPNKYTSCVRQLLHEGITPFPYKVAKALDPSMYRNIEFDSWNEIRKELKLNNWYHGDSNFKVGAKCHVKLCKKEQDLYTCHIQDIEFEKGQCIVYIEKLGEKRLVPYDSLRPLPPDQFKPWTVPYRFQRQFRKFSSIRFTREYNYKFRFHQSSDDGTSKGDYDDGHQFFNPKFIPSSYYKLKRFTHLENFQAHTVEFCTMPLTVQYNGAGEICESTNTGDGLPPGTAEHNIDASRANLTSSNTGVSTGVAIDATDQSAVNINPCTPIVEFGNPPVAGVYNLETYNAGTAIYVPEIPNYCQIYPYPAAGGNWDENYGVYGYDGGMVPVPAYMPAPNGAYCYVVSNGYAPPGSYMGPTCNQYMVGPPAIALQAAPPPNVPIYTTPGPYVPNGMALHCPNASSTGTLYSSAENSALNTPSPRPPQQRADGVEIQTATQNISQSIQINFDANKSIDANGSDLPTDVATLRFFYNLGLDSYNENKTKQQQELECQKREANTSESANGDSEQLSSDLQALNLNSQDNSVDDTPTSDANNNAILPESATTIAEKPPVPTQSGAAAGLNKNTIDSSSSSTGGGGNKPYHNRRYNSRFFGGKDRPMPHHQQHRNYESNSKPSHIPFNGPPQSQFNQQQNRNSNGNYRYKHYNHYNHYQASAQQNSTRSLQQYPLGSSSQQHNQGQQQFMGPISAAAIKMEPGVKPSLLGGYEDANNAMGKNRNTQSNAPKQRASDYDGVPMVAPTGGSVYVPMTLSNQPPPLPYELYANQQPPPNGFQSHPNFVNGHPMHMTPPPHGVTGTDVMENNGNGSAEMLPNGMVNVGTGMAPPPAPLQCTSYPPPPMPYVLGTGSGAIPLHPNGPVDNAGVHLIAHMGPPTPTNLNVPQQFSMPPPLTVMPPQGYFCVQTANLGQMPPPQQPPPLQPLPQQQQTTMAANNINNNNRGDGGISGEVATRANGTPTSSDSMPNNNNNNSVRPDKSSANQKNNADEMTRV